MGERTLAKVLGRGGRGGGEKKTEVLAELRDGAIEGHYRAVRTGEHDSAFHDDEDVGGESVDVGVVG